MGSGKSFWAEKLSRRLQIPFIDIDLEVEANENRSITSIFEKEGESYFRKAERQMLLDVIEEFPDAIIATGGGLPCYLDNMEIMNNHGKTIYIQTSPDMLYNRIVKDLNKRPILKKVELHKLKEFIVTHISEREGHYNMSKSILKNEDINEDNFLKLITSNA